MNRKGQKLVLAVTVDEMHIKKKIERVGDKLYGYPDLGFGEQCDNSPPATEVLVFIAVAVNGSWKIPVGYFFLNSLNAEQRSILIKECYQLLQGTGAQFSTLTFDGNQVNLTAACRLGASFDPLEEWHPFIHLKDSKGVTHRVEVMLDACHMIKLVRNVFANPDVEIYDNLGHPIEWKYVNLLLEYQEKEGLLAANKLKRRHVRFFNEKQKVKLAVQLLSRSVADALHVLEFELNIPEFSGAKPTADFVFVMNDIFDLLNSKNKYAPGLKGSLSARNIEEVVNFVAFAQNYIRGLSARVLNNRSKTWTTFSSIFRTRQKTGFLGLLSCLHGVLSMYDRFVRADIVTHLPTYKFSQDHVETFFSAIRRRGVWSNNPSCREFVSAYKRLLVHAQIACSDRANCWPIELTTILSVASTTSTHVSDRSADGGTVECVMPYETDEEDCGVDLVVLSRFVDDVIGYVAGYVSKSVSKKVHCSVCCEALFGDESSSALLTKKNRGGLLIPSLDVVNICKATEKEVRFLTANKKLLNVKTQRVVIRVKNSLACYPIFKCLDTHILEQNVLDNHTDSLVSRVIESFFKIRVNHESKKVTEKLLGDRVRTQNNKITLFKNQ